MRWVIRFLLLIVLAIGVILAFVYPWAADTMPGYDIGKWRVYDRAAGFVEAEASIAPSEAPVRATLQIYTDGVLANPDGAIVLTMTTATAGRTISAETFTLQDLQPRLLSPQSSERLYEFVPLVIETIDGDHYTFVFGPGEDDFPINAIDLTLNAGAIDVDPRVPPVGYVVIVLAVIGLMLSFRRRGENPNSSPPPRKWGRQ